MRAGHPPLAKTTQTVHSQTTTSNLIVSRSREVEEKKTYMHINPHDMPIEISTCPKPENSEESDSPKNAHSPSHQCHCVALINDAHWGSAKMKSDESRWWRNKSERVLRFDYSRRNNQLSKWQLCCVTESKWWKSQFTSMHERQTRKGSRVKWGKSIAVL